MQNAESSNSRRSRFTSVLASFEAKISAPQTSLKPATGRLSNGTLASPGNRLHYHKRAFGPIGPKARFLVGCFFVHPNKEFARALSGHTRKGRRGMVA